MSLFKYWNSKIKNFVWPPYLKPQTVKLDSIISSIGIGCKTWCVSVMLTPKVMTPQQSDFRIRQRRIIPIRASNFYFNRCCGICATMILPFSKADNRNLLAIQCKLSICAPFDWASQQNWPISSIVSEQTSNVLESVPCLRAVSYLGSAMENHLCKG